MITYIILIVFAAGGIGGGLMLGEFVRRVSGQRAFVNLFAIVGFVAGLLFGMKVDDDRIAEAHLKEARRQAALNYRSPSLVDEEEIAELTRNFLNSASERGPEPEPEKPLPAAAADPRPAGRTTGTPGVEPDIEERVAAIIGGIKREHRFYGLLFQASPQAEAKLREEITRIIQDTPPGNARAAAGRAAVQMIKDTYNTHALYGSDEATIRANEYRLRVLTALKQNPAACVDYYFGRLTSSDDVVGADLIRGESEVRADVLESALTDPSPPPYPLDEEKLYGLLFGAYAASGFDQGDLDLLEETVTSGRSDAAACEVVIREVQAILTLDPGDAGYVFKGMRLLE